MNGVTEDTQDDLRRRLLAGERRALAKAITLVESTRADHRASAQALLAGLMAHTGKAQRLGISGVPGVGKSTFIDALGMALIADGQRVAVLAVDPSSCVHGGSILGDKTRMARLSVHPDAFIRPSPTAGSLGGVAEKTREALLLCEAAGYDVVIVETVGVGQSETAVAGMTDMFVVLQLPNAGDDLQAIKRGIMELADLVVYNKTDLDAQASARAVAQMRAALGLLHAAAPGWTVPVLAVSALRGEGLDEFRAEVARFMAHQRATGALAQRRSRQALLWMWTQIDQGLREQWHSHPQVRAELPRLAADVEAGKVPPTLAAHHLLQMIQK